MRELIREAGGDANVTAVTKDDLEKPRVMMDNDIVSYKIHKNGDPKYPTSEMDPSAQKRIFREMKIRHPMSLKAFYGAVNGEDWDRAWQSLDRFNRSK